MICHKQPFSFLCFFLINHTSGSKVVVTHTSSEYHIVSSAFFLFRSCSIPSMVWIAPCGSRPFGHVLVHMPMFTQSSALSAWFRNSSLYLVYQSRESTIQRQAASRTAGPRYPSGFHQQEGQEVEQHAQRIQSQRPSSFLRSSWLCTYSWLPTLGVFRLRQGSIDLYCAQKLVMSTTRSLRTNICPRGVMQEISDRSGSTVLRQARVWIPLQFIEQDPQIPSLQDLLNERVGSRLSLMQNNASRYIGGIFFRSTQQLTYFGVSLMSSGLYLQMRNLFNWDFCSGVREVSCSTTKLGFVNPMMLAVMLSMKTLD